MKIKQKVRNNIHKARKHTQKASRDIRRLRERRRIEFANLTLEDLPIATRRAVEEARRYSEFLQAWEKSLEDNPIMYRIDSGSKFETLTLTRAGTHSELFGR